MKCPLHGINGCNQCGGFMRYPVYNAMGTYQLLPGINVPSSAELLSAAQGAIVGQVGGAVATSPASIQAAQNAAASQGGVAAMNWVKANPLVAAGVVIGAFIAVRYL